MIEMSLEEEASECRRIALVYVGQPGGSFLVRVAREFDRLAAERRFPPAREWSRQTQTPIILDT
jgi:hypothetical protein